MSATDRSPAGEHGSSEGDLNQLLLKAGLEPVSEDTAARFDTYLELILRWNQRTNLTAIRDRQGILTRHFVECIACAQALPAGISSLLDYGSGAGFPGVPIALCRPEIAVTLAESQNKKAAFLNEVVRSLGLSAVVHSGRAEKLSGKYKCVVLRAVDQMEEAVSSGARLVAPGGLLALMVGEGDSEKLCEAVGARFRWLESFRLPGSDRLQLVMGNRD